MFRARLTVPDASYDVAGRTARPGRTAGKAGATVIPPDLSPVGEVAAFLSHGLMLDPWLAGLDHEHFTFESQERLAGAASELAAGHEDDGVLARMLPDFTAAARFRRKICREVLNCTAAVVAQERLGRIRVDAATADEAVQRLERFVESVGFGALASVYTLVADTGNQGAVAYYGAIPQDEFVRGVRHRPWVHDTLADELQLGIAAGTLRIARHHGRAYVQQTPAGGNAYRRALRLLSESGFGEARLRLVQMSHFNLLADDERDLAQGWPGVGAYRPAFTDFARIAAGARVLEVGCGAGAQTFTGGLQRAVGPTGHLVGLDPAIRMVERARGNAEAHGATNVEFIQARAEAIPFTDRSFDAAVGMGFIPYAQGPRALAEMVRVTRPNGILAIGTGCAYASDAAWFQDWFGPLLHLVESSGGNMHPVLYSPGALEQMFDAAGLQHVEHGHQSGQTTFEGGGVGVSMLLYTVPHYQEALERLPWAARCELVDELRERGEVICRRTTVRERTASFPTEHVRGTVPELRPAAGRGTGACER